MAKVDIFCKIKKRNVSVDEKLAKVLVKANRATYSTKPVVEYNNRMMVAEKPREKLTLGVNIPLDNKEALKAKLDAAGIEYDGRWGEARLQEAVDSIGKDE